MQPFSLELLEHISDAFVALDRDWRYTFVNRKAGELFARDPQSLVGKHIWREFPDGVGQPFHRAYERAMEAQEPVVLEAFYPPWNRWYENRIHPSPDGLAIFFSDVTERKEGEWRLRESEARYRALFETSMDAVYAIGQDGRYTQANEACARMSGYPLEQFLRIGFDSVIAPDRLAETADLIRRTLAGESHNFDTALVRPDGTRVEINVSIVPHHGPAGIIGVFGIARDITERARVEARIRESEERHRLVARATHDVIYDWHLDTGELYWSDALRSVFGYEPAQSRTIGFWESRIHPEDVARVKEQAERVLAGADEFMEVEYRFRRADGSYASTLDRAFVVRDDRGRPVRMVGSFLDLTERLEAEAALRASEIRFRSLVEASASVVWIVDASGLVWEPVAEWSDFTGQSFEEYRDAGWLDAIHPDDRERTATAWRRAVETQSLYEVEHRLRRHDGEFRHMHARGVPVPNEDGSVREWVGTHTDVTERKRAEDALRESEERYRRIFEDDISGDFVTDAGGRIVECNNSFVRIFGFASRDEAVGHPMEELHVAPEARTALVATVVAEGRAELREFEMRSRNGEPMHVMKNVIGIFDEGGELIGTRGYIVDITQLRVLEEQLRQSQKMEAVGQLAGGVAHDFNNMLTAIIGHAQVLQDDLTDPCEVAEGLREIVRAAERSAALTRQLLAFSRRQVLVPKPTDLNAVVSGMLKLLRRLIGEHIRIETYLAPDPGVVHVDPGQMEQVLLNLAVNARDAMPSGGTLTIATEIVSIDPGAGRPFDQELRPGLHAVLSVHDTGVGMEEAVRSRVFEPFFTTKRVGEGTGLGLSMVYGIVKQSGGSVRVESEPWAGSTFTVYLPLHEQPAEVPVMPETPTPPAPSVGGSETVLLVEDEPSVRRLVRRVLLMDGYTVLEAGSGEEALRIVGDRHEPIDLLLSDVVMPGMSGPQIAEAIRPRHPSLSVIFMSGYADDAIRHHGTLEPGTSFIAKPFTPDGLRQRVREVLDADRS
jgi:two-component system, cell cycle sensor histidine kinase and response regulator CckA